jgi:hypothetical protein
MPKDGRSTLNAMLLPQESAVSARDASSRNSTRISGSESDAAAARRWVAAAGESGLDRSGAVVATGDRGTTFTVTELAHVPVACAAARICVCIKRRRDAQAGVDARKTRRSLRRLANRTCSRNGDGNVWRSARSTASSALALLASVAKEPQSTMDFGPCVARREVAGVTRCMEPDFDFGKTCKSYSSHVPGNCRKPLIWPIGACAPSLV